jgi:stage II sporulation protein M
MTTPKTEAKGLKRLLFGSYAEYAESLAPIFGLCCFLFSFSLGMGYILGETMPDTAFNDILGTFPDIANMSLPELFGFIAWNNTLKSLLFMLGGLLGGVLPLYFVIFNGFFIGWVVYSYGSAYGLGYIITGLTPHGIIEIPALILAMSIGMSLGYAALNSLRRQGSLMKETRSALGLFLTRIVPMLILAAVIEVTITPIIMALLGYV